MLNPKNNAQEWYFKLCDCQWGYVLEQQVILVSPPLVSVSPVCTMEQVYAQHVNRVGPAVNLEVLWVL